MNNIIAIAQQAKRNYITPEDVTKALSTNSEDQVRKDVLEVLGGKFGAEDAELCAWIAWRGRN